MASNSQDSSTLAQGIPTIGVGQSLKTARELTGKGIEEVAQHLRIRTPFLQALEDGRHKDLPGGTYAVGFLRTYAEFLGLDGEEMVRRFRAEAAGDLNARSELVFPSPVSEGRIPGGAVLFLGLLLAGVAYGAWYFLSSRTTEVAEMVPPLPDRLASALNRPATVTGEAAKPTEAPKAEEPAKIEEAAPSPATPGTIGKETEVVPPQEEEEAKAPTPAAPPSSAVTATPANTPKADAGKLEAGKVEQTKPGQPSKPEAEKPVAPQPQTAAPAQPPQTQAPAPVVQAPATPAAPQPSPTVAAPAAPTAVPDGKVIGQEHSDSRVQLKAVNDDCWVQVRELDGQLLLSRLLRRGDSYMVPNRPGLTLMVGNAGALEVSVDGKKAAPLGNSGQVRRDIKLDPDKLAAGN